MVDVLEDFLAFSAIELDFFYNVKERAGWSANFKTFQAFRVRAGFVALLPEIEAIFAVEDCTELTHDAIKDHVFADNANERLVDGLRGLVRF